MNANSFLSQNNERRGHLWQQVDRVHTASDEDELLVNSTIHPADWVGRKGGLKRAAYLQ